MNSRVGFLVLVSLLMISAFQNCAKENFSQVAPSLFSNTGATPQSSPPGTDTGTPTTPTTPNASSGNLPLTYGCSNNGTSSTGTNLLETTGVVLELYTVSISGQTATLSQAQTVSNDAVALRNTILQNKSIPIPVSSLTAGTYTALLCPSDTSGNVSADCSLSLHKGQVDHNGRISMNQVSLGKSDLAPNNKFPGSNLVTFEISSAGQFSSNRSLEVLYDSNDNNSNQAQCDDTASPLMIHLDDVGHSSVQLSSPQNGVLFDILNDGVKNQISWPLNPSVDVFLTLPTAQGQVLSSQELFGNETVGPDGERATNGFAALAKWAPAGAKNIDSSTAIYGKLRLWADVNRNGVVDPGELFTLSEKNISSISLLYQNIYEVDTYGNQTRERSSVSSGDDTYTIFDLWFKY